MLKIQLYDFTYSFWFKPALVGVLLTILIRIEGISLSYNKAGFIRVINGRGGRPVILVYAGRG